MPREAHVFSGLDRQPFRFLTIAAFDWRNGHEHALQAMTLLRELNVPFHYRIVGDGPFLEALAFARYQMDLEASVDLTLLPAWRTTAIEAFGPTDLFILAAVAPGVQPALEAAIRGWIPVLHTDVVEPIRTTGGQVLIVPRRDSRAIARCICDKFIPAQRRAYA